MAFNVQLTQTSNDCRMLTCTNGWIWSGAYYWPRQCEVRGTPVPSDARITVQRTVVENKKVAAVRGGLLGMPELVVPASKQQQCSDTCFDKRLAMSKTEDAGGHFDRGCNLAKLADAIVYNMVVKFSLVHDLE